MSSARALVLVPLTLVLVPASALGQPTTQPTTQPPTQPTTSRVSEAREHTARAMRHLRVHEYRDAIREFELAYAAAPSPELWYNIARSHEMLREYDEAVDYYQRYLRDKVDPPDLREVQERIEELRQRAERARLARLRQASGTTLRFEVSHRDARVFLDGRPLAVSPSGGSVPVSAGVHRVLVQAPGTQAWQAEVRARPDDETVVFATPARATRFRTTPRSHLWSYLLGGLGLASLGTSAYFGISALGTDCVDCASRSNRAEASDVFLGVGVGLALAATVVYFIERGSSRTELAP